MTHRMLTGGFVVLLLAAAPVRAADPDILHIGFVESLLQEGKPGVRDLLGSEFTGLVRNAAGLKSVVLEGISPATAARQLDREKWHLGIFHGVEFAWIQPSHPQLRPLMVTTTHVDPVRAALVVGKDSNVQGFADLKGKNVTMQMNLHCRLFTNKGTGNAPNFFGKFQESRNMEDTLNDVEQGKIPAAIVDNSALAFYKELQPGRFNRLKIAAQSEPFPPAVIVYRQGVLSDGLLERLKQGMLKAKDSDRGRETLQAFGITGFQAVPANFQQELTRIAKDYPAKE